MPLPWLRQLTRALMAATVAANAAAGWPDPVATGLQVFAPVLLLAMTEAGRAALLRRLRVADGHYRQPIPLARWVLALRSSFRLWRRMVLWQITSYPAALALEQRRLHAIHRLATRFGADWRAAVPDDIAWMLDEGVLLDVALARVSELTGPDITPDMPDAAGAEPPDVAQPDPSNVAGHQPNRRRRASKVRARSRRTAGGHDGKTPESQALDIVAAEPDITGGELGRRLNLSERQGQRLRNHAMQRLTRRESPA